jgi:hypothetical protein
MGLGGTSGEGGRGACVGAAVVAPADVAGWGGATCSRGCWLSPRHRPLWCEGWIPMRSGGLNFLLPGSSLPRHSGLGFLPRSLLLHQQRLALSHPDPNLH